MTDFNMNYGPKAADPYGNNILGQQYQMPGSQYSMDQFQIPGGAPPAAGGGAGGMFGMNSLFGGTAADGTQSNGWVSPALSTFSGLTNAWLGLQQYGLAKDSLKESKRQFNKNFEVQKNLTNSQLSDRQNARIAASPNAGHKNTAEYMAKYGVK